MILRWKIQNFKDLLKNTVINILVLYKFLNLLELSQPVERLSKFKKKIFHFWSLRAFSFTKHHCLLFKERINSWFGEGNQVYESLKAHRKVKELVLCFFINIKSSAKHQHNCFFSPPDTTDTCLCASWVSCKMMSAESQSNLRLSCFKGNHSSGLFL